MPGTLKKYFTASLVISIASTFLALLAKPFLPPQIPLFYGLPESEEQLSLSLGLCLPGIFSLIILTLNFFLAKTVKDEFLKKTLAVAALIVSVFMIITTVKIIFLVGGF